MLTKRGLMVLGSAAALVVSVGVYVIFFRGGPTNDVTDAALLPMKYKDHNVILVSFDALGAAHVGSLGNPRNVTPTLDAFAGKAFNFTHAYSVASWTVPASMTWFTGVYPSEHRLTNKFAIYRKDVQKLANLKELAPQLVTLADLLKQSGYITGGFTGNAGVSGGFGYEQGFDVYFHEHDKFGRLDHSVPEALKWLKRGYKSGAPLSMFYQGRIYSGFLLEKVEKDPRRKSQPRRELWSHPTHKAYEKADRNRDYWTEHELLKSLR